MKGDYTYIVHVTGLCNALHVVQCTVHVHCTCMCVWPGPLFPSDEALREKVLGLIEKQKRPKKPNSMSSSEITMQIGPSETRHHSRKTSSHSITDIMTEKKGKKIEVEASVNINDGVAAATIIQIDGNVVRHVQHDADHGSPRQHAIKAASLGGNHIGDPTADRQSLRAPSLSPEHRAGGGVGGGVGGGGGGTKSSCWE